jgi:hypothetical protein
MDQTRAVVLPCNQTHEPKDWNQSVSLCELEKEKRTRLRRFDSMRTSSRTMCDSYQSPSQRSTSVGEHVRALKREYMNLRQAYIRGVQFDYQDISRENTEAKAFKIFVEQSRQRMLSLSSEFSRHANAKQRVLPNPRITRRIHTGVFDSNRKEWSCCSSSNPEAPGCEPVKSSTSTWCLFP